MVKELHANHKIKSIFEYRRRAAEKKNSQLTITEQLLRFLQVSHRHDPMSLLSIPSVLLAKGFVLIGIIHRDFPFSFPPLMPN